MKNNKNTRQEITNVKENQNYIVDRLIEISLTSAELVDEFYKNKEEYEKNIKEIKDKIKVIRKNNAYYEKSLDLLWKLLDFFVLILIINIAITIYLILK